MHTPSVREREEFWHRDYLRGAVFAHRTPMLSFRFTSTFLLRCGARTCERVIVPLTAAQDGLVRPGPRLWSRGSAQAFCGKQ